MKRIFFIAISILLITQTGCLKDKGFEDQKYGIKNPGDVSPKGVGFSLLDNSYFKKTVGIDSTSRAQNLDTNKNALVLGFYAGTAAEKDVHVKIEVQNTLITKFNDEFDETITELDPSVYTIVTDVVIPAGQQYVPINVLIPSTTMLSYGEYYGIGLKIISVDNGYTIAQNMSEMVYEIVLRNKYDGDYVSNGYFYHPSVPRGINERKKTISTINTTSSAVELGDLGGSGYYAILDVNSATNAVTIRRFPGSVNVVTFTNGLPTTNPGYIPKWDGSPECNNVYVPSEEAFKVRYGYVGGTGYRVTEEIIKKL